MFNELNFNFELILRIAIINFQEIFVLIIKHEGSFKGFVIGYVNE